jgi:hypothetical protein
LSNRLVESGEEQFMERRVLVPQIWSEPFTVDGIQYARQATPGMCPLYNKIISRHPKDVSIDGEDFLEYRVLSRLVD